MSPDRHRSRSASPRDFCDPAVKALDQTVGLGMARRRQPVLNAKVHTELVEDVAPRGLPVMSPTIALTADGRHCSPVAP